MTRDLFVGLVLGGTLVALAILAVEVAT